MIVIEEVRLFHLVQEHLIILTPVCLLIWMVIKAYINGAKDRLKKLEKEFVEYHERLDKIEQYCHFRIHELATKMQLQLIDREEIEYGKKGSETSPK